MNEEFQVGDQVQIRLYGRFGGFDGWFEGTIVRIEPYSTHRSFHWVELDEESQLIAGIKQISIFNPKNIRKV